MLFIVLTASALTCFEMYNLSKHTGPKVFKTLLGYSWIPEVTCSIILPVIAMSTGSLTGVLISVVAGFFFTITLEVSKRVIGYRKYKRGEGWIETKGIPLSQFIRELGINTYNKLIGFGRGVVNA